MLADFLSRAAAKGFAWGEHDCMLFAADWAHALSGTDPAADYRGTYSSAHGAKAILAREGGLGALMRKCLAPLGWEYDTGVTDGGEIVIVHAPTATGLHLVAGVHAGSQRIALVTERGLVIAPAQIWMAYRHG